LAVSSARRGTPVAHRIADLDRLVTWLSELHRQGDPGRAPWDDVRRSQWVEAPLEAYAESFGTRAGEDRLFAEVRRRAASLSGAALPTVWVHMDLNTWNVIRDGRDLTIIDWAGARAGPPLVDLLYLVTCWSHEARELTGAAARIDDFRRLFLEHPRDLGQDAIPATPHRPGAPPWRGRSPLPRAVPRRPWGLEGRRGSGGCPGGGLRARAGRGPRPALRRRPRQIVKDLDQPVGQPPEAVAEDDASPEVRAHP